MQLQRNWRSPTSGQYCELIDTLKATIDQMSLRFYRRLPLVERVSEDAIKWSVLVPPETTTGMEPEAIISQMC